MPASSSARRQPSDLAFRRHGGTARQLPVAEPSDLAHRRHGGTARQLPVAEQTEGSRPPSPLLPPPDRGTQRDQSRKQSRKGTAAAGVRRTPQASDSAGKPSRPPPRGPTTATGCCGERARLP
eukprot:365199-Chlamydomonas_euryale.AAC.13